MYILRILVDSGQDWVDQMHNTCSIFHWTVFLLSCGWTHCRTLSLHLYTSCINCTADSRRCCLCPCNRSLDSYSGTTYSWNSYRYSNASHTHLLRRNEHQNGRHSKEARKKADETRTVYYLLICVEWYLHHYLWCVPSYTLTLSVCSINMQGLLY